MGNKIREEDEDDGSSSSSSDLSFRCNICGSRADFVVQLELVKGSNRFSTLHSQQVPFYLCRGHEYLYKKMKGSIELKDYFSETIKENQ